MNTTLLECPECDSPEVTPMAGECYRCEECGWVFDESDAPVGRVQIRKSSARRSEH